MEWCVCSNREGVLSLMTRYEREEMLKILGPLKKGVPTHVVKTFENKKDAKKYISDIKRVNKLIKKI
jgi:hypothetical protein